MKFSPQQIRAIKMSPKGQLPKFVASTIKSKEPKYAMLNSRGGYSVKPFSKYSANQRLYGNTFGDKLAK